jgi:hypothetical protein
MEQRPISSQIEMPVVAVAMNNSNTKPNQAMHLPETPGGVPASDGYR